MATAEQQRPSITLERRREILAKDLLTINELGELLSLPYSTAANIMRKIKRKTDRLDLTGMLHVQDYLDYFHLPPDRYYGITIQIGTEQPRYAKAEG